MKFKERDRVFVHDMNGDRCYGFIRKNVDHPNVSEWYIEYDDGKQMAVLDLNQVYQIGRAHV